MRSAIRAPAAEPDSSREAAAEGRAPGRPAGGSLAVRGLGHSFGETDVFEELSLEVAAGEVLGIVGPSGCGKSTLLELVAGLREPATGSIAIDGATAAAERLAGCAYMPQRDLLFPWLSAIDNAALAPRNRGARKAAARDEARLLFERFGLGGFELSRPGELSGGMRQRVAFLRTLLTGKPVLLLDEPFASLDAITRAAMQEWLTEAVASEPRTVVLVTHDVEEALYLADRVAVLSSRPGRLVGEHSTKSARARPRAKAVTDPGFVGLRERALADLMEGSG